MSVVQIGPNAAVAYGRDVAAVFAAALNRYPHGVSIDTP
jgi:hypothetical protein